MDKNKEKIITFAVPCYNSAEYMEHCIDSLLEGGDDIEIILVNDGSTKDNTAEICDRYASLYPDIVRTIHQKNGGHGEGVNQGIRQGKGVYYKVVDSDDWVDVPALHKILEKLRQFVRLEKLVDMLVSNFVYEHADTDSQRVMSYGNVFPRNKVFGWEQIGRFRRSQYLMMHSVIYRMDLLRECGLELPKHTFYVDNLFIYIPLPMVKNIYYLDVDFYRYYIGREDQSVNEDVMVGRVDQQLKVTYMMLQAHDLREVAHQHKRLERYMFRHLNMLVCISSVMLILNGSPECLGERTRLWEEVRAIDSGLYRRMKHALVSAATNIPGYQGRKLSVKFYRIARRIYKFN